MRANGSLAPWRSKLTPTHIPQATQFPPHFSFNADPANYGITWWGAQENQLLIDIQASLDGGQSWTSLITAQVDGMAAHLDQGLIEVGGRDLTGNFIDARADPSSFINQTSSQVVQTLASGHGMQSDVTATTALIGAYDGMNNTLSSSVTPAP
jgi:hypothetical protein